MVGGFGKKARMVLKEFWYNECRLENGTRARVVERFETKVKEMF